MNDLFEVLSRHSGDGHLSRETIRLISTLLERSPELAPIFHASLQNFASQIVSLVTSRSGETARPEAELLAELVSHELGHAIRSWSQSGDMSKAEITRLARQHIENMGKLIGNGRETPSR